MGGDLTRMSPEITDLTRDEMQAVHPSQMGSGITVMTSVLSSILVRRRRVRDLMSRVAAPTLLLWGDDDRLVVRASIDEWTALRPDWELTVLEGVGHAPPLEVPTDYARAVGDWTGQLSSIL